MKTDGEQTYIEAQRAPIGQRLSSYFPVFIHDDTNEKQMNNTNEGICHPPSARHQPSLCNIH